jgi:protein-S-isoprenylcysteine O-methyltransferase Ste14
MAYLLALDVDPSIVKPGWTALIVVLLLAAAMALLFWSMRRQFRKINVADDATEQPDASKSTSPDGAA